MAIAATLFQGSGPGKPRRPRSACSIQYHRMHGKGESAPILEKLDRLIKAMDPEPMKFKIELDGRSWSGDEVEKRLKFLPEKFEVINGKLFWDDRERLDLLALLLENVGIKKALSLGDLKKWRQALLETSQSGESSELND